MNAYNGDVRSHSKNTYLNKPEEAVPVVLVALVVLAVPAVEVRVGEDLVVVAPQEQLALEEPVG